MNVFNIFKVYVFFFFVFFYFHESIFFNEEILLSISLFSMFYIAYTYFSSLVWTFIKMEIDEIRACIIDEFEDQLDRCYSCLFLLQSSIKIFYIPVFFCLWVYLINSFVIRLGLTRLDVGTNKFFFYAARRLFTEHLKVLSSLEFKKVSSFLKFIQVFSFFLFNYSKNVFVYIFRSDEQRSSLFDQLSFVYSFSSVKHNSIAALSVAQNDPSSDRFFNHLQKNEMFFAVSSLKFSLILQSFSKYDSIPFLFYFNFLILKRYKNVYLGF